MFQRGGAHLGAQLNMQSLFFKGFGRLFGHLFISGAEECGQPFQNRDFGAQPSPHAAQFQANHARADNAECARHGGQTQRAIVGQNIFFIKGCARQAAWHRTRGKNNLRRRQGLRIFPVHGNFIPAACCPHK